METLSKDFPVYIIKSSWSLSRIDEFLKYYEDVPFLRIVHNKDGTETNKTIVILNKATYEKLCDNGYGNKIAVHELQHPSNKKGFYIYPFLLDEHDFPLDKSNRTLFVPVPKSLSKDDTFVAMTIADKLQHISEQNIIKEDSWNNHIPLVSREKGGIKSGCFITFNEEITISEIAMVKILLCDTYWPERNELEERLTFRCSWVKDNRNKDSKNKDVFGSKRILLRTDILPDEQPTLK